MTFQKCDYDIHENGSIHDTTTVQIFEFCKSQRSLKRVLIIFYELYGLHKHPSGSIIGRINDNLQGMARSKNIDFILENVAEGPEKCICLHSQQVGVCGTATWRILHKNKTL